MNTNEPKPNQALNAEQEHFLAELTQASYDVALTHGIPGSFVNVQLDMWAALRRVVDDYVRSRRSPAYSYESFIAHLGIEIDKAEHSATYRGRKLNLTPTEFRLLAYLIENPGRVFSRQELLVPALETDAVTERTIDVHVKTLRYKLGAAELIETVRGIGYRIRKHRNETDEPGLGDVSESLLTAAASA